MKNINQFCTETGFRYEVGEVGFGRPCVGIIDNGSYVDCAIYDPKTYDLIAESTAERASNAYHKHDCLAVLIEDRTEEEATRELEEWVGRILEKGYQIKTHVVTNSIGAVFRGGRETLKAVVDR